MAIPAATADLKGDLSLGREVYLEVCASCHGKRGDGRGTGYKDKMPLPQVLANPSYMMRLTPQYMFDVVKYGKIAVLKGEKKTGHYQVMPMPGFEGALEDDVILALVGYIKSLRTGRWNPSKRGKLTGGNSREYYEAACAECHGPAGRGDGPTAVGGQDPRKPFVSVVQPAPADLTDPVLMTRFSDRFIFSLIKFVISTPSMSRTTIR